MNFVVVVYNNYSIVVYRGNTMTLDLHCFKALNDNLEARLFLHAHFHASDLLMVCRPMQLFKTGNSVNLGL